MDVLDLFQKLSVDYKAYGSSFSKIHDLLIQIDPRFRQGKLMMAAIGTDKPHAYGETIEYVLCAGRDERISSFAKLSRTQCKSHTAYIIELTEHAVDTDYVPAREGEDFRALTSAGGEATLMRHDRYVAGGMAGLNKAQKSAYERARKVASPENGSQWKEARKILENAGFSVYKLYAVASEAI